MHGAVESFAVLRRYAGYVSHRRFGTARRSHFDVIAPLTVSKRRQADDVQLSKERRPGTKPLLCAGPIPYTLSDAITNETF